jgi:hypothetical protein
VMRDRYFRPRLQATRVVIARAVARGEIRADADAELAFDLLFGPLAYRWLRGSPPDEDTISRLTGLALKGLEPLGAGLLYKKANESGERGSEDRDQDVRRRNLVL